MKIQTRCINLYPVLSTKIEIANVQDVKSSKGVDYINVAFFDDRGYPNSLWFPFEFKDFALANLHKVVTAEVRFYRGNKDRPANLSGVSLK